MSKSTSPDWKLRLNSILDNAKEEVVGRSSKTASAPPEPTGLLKQAGDVVSALKLVTGQTDQMTLADILRKEGAAGKSPGVVETSTRGTQAEAPRSGSGSVKASPGPGAARPTESEAGTKGASLFDIIQQGREAAEKSAGKGGPSELEANDASGKTPSGLSKLVGSSEAVVNATKRTALAQTRPSLQSLFANANDSANEGAARAAFPAAVGKGGLKIASDLEKARAFQKSAGNAEQFGRTYGSMIDSEELPPHIVEALHQHLLQQRAETPASPTPGPAMAISGAMGGLGGAALGGLMGNANGAPGKGALLGGALGAGLGAWGGHDVWKKNMGEIDEAKQTLGSPDAMKAHLYRSLGAGRTAEASATPLQIAIEAQRALATA